jgi:hypothetical protein
MLATKVLGPATSATASDPAGLTPVMARRLFDALGALHNCREYDFELITRAWAGLRLIRTAGAYTGVEHTLFRLALADLGESDAWVVENAACYASDYAVGPLGWREADRELTRRALWFAAILRLAEVLSDSPDAPAGLFCVWTQDTLYLEFDGDGMTEPRLQEARNRVAALEALVQRRVVLASAVARREACAS